MFGGGRRREVFTLNARDEDDVVVVVELKLLTFCPPICFVHYVAMLNARDFPFGSNYRCRSPTCGLAACFASVL